MEHATTMNTTVTVETVHGLKDKFVVGSNGLVLVSKSAKPLDAKSNDASVAAAPTSQPTAEDRPSTN